VTYEEESEKKKGSIVNYSIIGFLMLVVIMRIWPSVIPFSLFQFWEFKGDAKELLISSWPLFAWGAGFTAIVSLLTRNSREENSDAEGSLFFGVLVSVFAGVFEEIAFRWIFFYVAIASLKVVNFLIFGWLGFGVAEWFATTLAIPLADFATLGHLKPFLYGSGWAVGGAILSSNGRFRREHAYLGFVGWVNSWFCGMLLFYIMFTHGLLAAMLVHFLYDLFIYLVRYVDAVIERALGW
jgi:hypothetical protein